MILLPIPELIPELLLAGAELLAAVALAPVPVLAAGVEPVLAAEL